MQTILWTPPGLESSLAGVSVPPGQLTEGQWWEALADRVERLVLQEPDPQQAAEQAAKALGMVAPDYPAQAGQCLVARNLDLRHAMTAAMLAANQQFPVTVRTPAPGAEQALKRTDLASWVDQALSMVSESSLD